MEIPTIGIDLGKNVFHLGVKRGEVVVRKEVLMDSAASLRIKLSFLPDRHGSCETRTLWAELCANRGTMEAGTMIDCLETGAAFGATLYRHFVLACAPGCDVDNRSI